MVNDERGRPQRKSMRPAPSNPRSPRSGSSGASSRSGASGAAPRSGTSGTTPRRPSTRTTQQRPVSGAARARGRAEYERAVTQGRPRTQTSGGKGGGKGGGGGKNGPHLDKHGRPIPPWKYRLRRIGFGALIAGLATALIGFLALFIRYQMLEIPEPSDFALYEASTIYYADGVTVMGRLGQADRDIVDIDTLPDYVPNAFVAAEDRTFYTNPGVDFGGTTRALFKTVVLGKKQGGSTISQQYVERYYVGETTTDMMGKVDEALMALKINQQQDKRELLGNYINTIYFGRGAYGVEAAARKYYGKSAADMTISEAAMIAGILPAPSRWDPAVNREQAEYRWNYVLDGMVSLGYITQAERATQVFPETIPYQNTDVFGGPKGYLLRAALDEIERVTGITQEQIETQGMSIVTTIDPAHQQAIEDAVAGMPEGAAPNLRVAALTMDPATGAVTGMYGGADYLEIQRNSVTQDIAQAGSTFKPFTLVAALESGISLDSIYNGDQPKKVTGFDNDVRNFAGVSYGDIDLVNATAYSVNTAYAQLNMDVGPDKTRDVAVRAGIPEDTTGLGATPSNVLGPASPHAIDLAHAYATFATGGVRTEPFMVASITYADGTEYYQHQVVPERVFAEDVMADTTFAMQQVVNFRSGSGRPAAELGRPIAGKTGTSSDNRSAWFVGFTPNQLGVVGMWQVGPNGEEETITPFGGYSQITGGSVPVRVWTAMMGPILAPLDVVSFPPRANVGVASTPTPSPSPTPSPTPSPQPSPTPTPQPTPQPTQTPPVPDPQALGLGLLGKRDA